MRYFRPQYKINELDHGKTNNLSHLETNNLFIYVLIYLISHLLPGYITIKLKQIEKVYLSRPFKKIRLLEMIL